MIKFNKHNVKNIETGEKARVRYSLDNHISGKKCVFIYGKTILEDLTKVFSNVKNNSDSMTDYYESDCVRLFEGDLHYNEARKIAEAL